MCVRVALMMVMMTILAKDERKGEGTGVAGAIVRSYAYLG